MDKVEMQIAAIVNSESQPNNFVVIMKEIDGNRRLPVVVGGFEAQAIALAVENIQPGRPLTHDLFKTAINAFGAKVIEAYITQLKEGVFYAVLKCLKETGEVLEFDSRTSDAIAMAVRFGCPIFANASILDEAGIALEEPGARTLAPRQPVLEEQDIGQLKNMLDEALGNEEYEKAAAIRDELRRRENH